MCNQPLIHKDMNDYNKKSLINLGIMILLLALIGSFAVNCYNVVHGIAVPFIATVLPVVTIIYGAVTFVKKYLILK